MTKGRASFWGAIPADNCCLSLLNRGVSIGIYTISRVARRPFHTLDLLDSLAWYSSNLRYPVHGSDAPSAPIGEVKAGSITAFVPGILEKTCHAQRKHRHSYGRFL